MSNAVDYLGGPRLAGGQVDIGPFEFRFESNLKGYLAGASNATAGAGVPLQSPYAADQVQAGAMPTNAIDWVLVSARSAPTSPPSASVSALLLADGRVVMPDGGTNVLIEAKGSQHLVLQHRNHLAVMTAAPVLTNRIGSFDFSTNVWGVLGTTNSLTPLGSNRWGMVAGDADGDGAVRAVDNLIRQTQVGN